MKDLLNCAQEFKARRDLARRMNDLLELDWFHKESEQGRREQLEKQAIDAIGRGACLDKPISKRKEKMDKSLRFSSFAFSRDVLDVAVVIGSLPLTQALLEALEKQDALRDRLNDTGLGAGRADKIKPVYVHVQNALPVWVGSATVHWGMHMRKIPIEVHQQHRHQEHLKIGHALLSSKLFLQLKEREDWADELMKKTDLGNAFGEAGMDVLEVLIEHGAHPQRLWQNVGSKWERLSGELMRPIWASEQKELLLDELCEIQIEKNEGKRKM